jgi:hypothetical protein
MAEFGGIIAFPDDAKMLIRGYFDEPSSAPAASPAMDNQR